MKINIIVCSSVLAAMAAVAVAAGSAKAVGCVSAFQTVWTQQARCPGANSSTAYSQGIGSSGTSNARVRADLQFEVLGGQPDEADALGVTSDNRLAGTAPCSQGAGTPGCIFCRAIDTDPSSDYVDSPIGVCQQAVKHYLNLHF